MNGIGAAAIRDAMRSELIVIDEIAPMEFKSQEFIRAVEQGLEASGKYFELKVYQGQPHGFMIENGAVLWRRTLTGRWWHSLKPEQP